MVAQATSAASGLVSEGQRGNSYATSPAGRASEIHDKRLKVRAYSKPTCPPQTHGEDGAVSICNRIEQDELGYRIQQHRCLRKGAGVIEDAADSGPRGGEAA